MSIEWFENKAGLGVAEIVSLEGQYRLDSLVAAVDAALSVKEASGAALNEEQRTILAVEALERDVNNGGFAHFFGDASWKHVPVLVKSLERVGSKEALGLVKEAVSLLKLSSAILNDPAQLFETIHAALAKHEVEIRLNDLDSDYYVVEEDLGKLVWNYAKKNVVALSA